MKSVIILQGLAAGIAIMLPQNSLRGEEATILSPFVGETTREFEARKQGLTIREGEGGDPLTVPADSSGHFFLDATLNGRSVRMLVDTGASLVTLSHEDAALMSIRPSDRDYTRKVMTANGVVQAALIQIPEIRVGRIAVQNVEALVLPAGRLKTSLLGMTFLKRLSAFKISDGKLALHP